MTTDAPEDGRILDALFALVMARKDANPQSSYTAKLYAKGVDKIAQKLGEEAVEAVIEGVKGDPAKLAAESADLLYHLMVLWAARGVDPAEVWAILKSRQGVSGIVEKNNRVL